MATDAAVLFGRGLGFVGPMSLGSFFGVDLLVVGDLILVSRALGLIKLGEGSTGSRAVSVAAAVSFTG